MTIGASVPRFCIISTLILVLAGVLPGQSFLSELQAERDPAKRSDKALAFADDMFENARTYYSRGEIHQGDIELDDMTKALKECVGSLEEANKSRYYKKAEQRVALLQRRLEGLLSDIDVQSRGWAEYTQRKVDEIHDQLLQGVMKK